VFRNHTAAALTLALLCLVPGSRAEEPGDALLARALTIQETTPDELRSLVETIGGVPFLAPVAIDYLSYEALSEYLRALVESDYPVAEASGDARMLAAFDLLEPGTDLRALRLRLLEQNVAGFYDERPEKRRLFVVSEERRLTALNQIILAHELRHAVQDQYAAVHEILDPAVGDFDDRRMALLALLEGDATLVMERFVRKRLESEGKGTLPDLEDMALPATALQQAPAVLRDLMELPYEIGLPFVRRIVDRGGWTAVTEAWCRPPDSTEQVLHPEKYWARERPEPPEVAYVPPKATLLKEGVLGEAFVRTLLGGKAHATAASGWGGDAFRVWDVAGRTLLVWSARWDSEADAREFDAAFLARLSHSHTRNKATGAWRRFVKGTWTAASLRRGRDVFLVSGDDRRAVERAMRELGRR
jgi:hypothetical protein